MPEYSELITRADILALATHNRYREASQVAPELSDLLESIGDPTLSVGLLFAAVYPKAVAGETTDSLRLAQRVIDLAVVIPPRAA